MSVNDLTDDALVDAASGTAAVNGISVRVHAVDSKELEAMVEEYVEHS